MSKKKWKKQPAIQGKLGGCLNCGERPSVLHLEATIAVGFGDACVTCDGERVYEEPKDWGELWTVADAEELAASDPVHDWRIVLHGPLSGRTYQRHSARTWVLIEQNMGFA